MENAEKWIEKIPNNDSSKIKKSNIKLKLLVGFERVQNKKK